MNLSIKEQKDLDEAIKEAKAGVEYLKSHPEIYGLKMKHVTLARIKPAKKIEPAIKHVILIENLIPTVEIKSKKIPYKFRGILKNYQTNTV